MCATWLVYVHATIDWHASCVLEAQWIRAWCDLLWSALSVMWVCIWVWDSVCVCGCEYVRACVCVWACVCVCIYMIYRYVDMQFKSMHAHTHACTHTCTRTHTHTHTHTQTQKYTNTHTHTHTQKYTYTHIHTHVNVPWYRIYSSRSLSCLADFNDIKLAQMIGPQRRNRSTILGWQFGMASGTGKKLPWKYLDGGHK